MKSELGTDDSVDGRNPAPVDMVNILLCYYLQGFLHPRWLAGFLNHQRRVVSANMICGTRPHDQLFYPCRPI